MDKSIKLRINICDEAVSQLDGQMRIANFAYNKLLERANALKTEYKSNQSSEVSKILYTKYGLRNLLPEIKKELPFLKTVHSSPLKNAALRLSESIQAYQKSRKKKRKGKKTGWPQFRSHKRNPFSLLYDEPNKGFKINGNELLISCGKDENGKKIKVSGMLETPLGIFDSIEIRQLRIKQELGQFFAIFTVKTVAPKKIDNIEKIIALDPNHKNLAVGIDTDGNILELSNPYFSKSLPKRIDDLKSKRDKCIKKSIHKQTEGGALYWEPSLRWKKLNGCLQNVYRKRREQTKTFLFSYANYLFSKYDIVGIGDYTPRGGGISRGMRRQMNNESLIGRFQKTLIWVSEKSGKYCEIWPERKSTKTCADCKKEHPKSLDPSIRAWICLNCNKHHDRDVNAARNGLQRVLGAWDLENTLLPCSGHSLNEFGGCAVHWSGLGLDITSRPGSAPSSLGARWAEIQ